MRQKNSSFIRMIGWAGLVSSASLLAAWCALIALLQGELRAMVMLAALAFALDSFDGFVARRLHTSSEFGRQLDSMIDAFNYSLLSALITWKLLLPGPLGVGVGFLILLFGIFRLVRFNQEGYLDDTDHRYYRGVVTCHLSLATIGLLPVKTQVVLPAALTAALLIILAILQLSDIRTRKDGTLPFWFGIAIVYVIGAIAWLS